MKLQDNQAVLLFTADGDNVQMEVIGEPGPARTWAEDTWQDIVDTEGLVFLASSDCDGGYEN